MSGPGDDPVADDPATGDPISDGPATSARPSGDFAAGDPVARDPVPGDPVSDGPATSARPSGDPPPSDATVEAEREGRLRALTDDGDTIPIDQYRSRSRRSFLTFGAIGVGSFLGFRYLQNRPTDDRIPDAIRNGLEFNEAVWERLQRESATSPTFSIAQREDIRVNGRIGLRSDLDADEWSVRVVGVDGAGLDTIDLTDVQTLETHDIVWEHKCIEGWANIVHWTGARFSDFVARYAADQPDWEYVSLRTPDEEYYVGLDRFTMMHSQTLLAWQLNGEPLTPDHGAPLRLVTPIKYGIKQLKRVGTIEFTNERPADYWAERGYDWHAGF